MDEQAEKEGQRSDPRQPVPTGGDACRYAIRVQGHLDPEWSDWLGGMSIAHEEGGETRLEGVLPDQAALHGLLNRLWSLNLPLLAVQRLAL
jgi:hypothetical protein